MQHKPEHPLLAPDLSADLVVVSIAHAEEEMSFSVCWSVCFTSESCISPPSEIPSAFLQPTQDVFALQGARP